MLPHGEIQKLLHTLANIANGYTLDVKGRRSCSGLRYQSAADAILTNYLDFAS